MKTRAAVAVAAGRPLEVAKVDLEGPREGEIMVEMKATGACPPTRSPCRAPIRKASRSGAR